MRSVAAVWSLGQGGLLPARSDWESSGVAERIQRSGPIRLRLPPAESCYPQISFATFRSLLSIRPVENRPSDHEDPYVNHGNRVTAGSAKGNSKDSKSMHCLLPGFPERILSRRGSRQMKLNSVRALGVARAVLKSEGQPV